MPKKLKVMTSIRNLTLIVLATFLLTNCSSKITIIPDSKFEKVLIELGIDSDGIINGKVLTADINTIEFLSVERKNIYDLTGIEGFKLLKNLSCHENQISDLDLSQNIYLEELNCIGNQINNLDMTKNGILKNLYCSNNQLENLNISKCSNLTILNCFKNKLEVLDISQNKNLKKLICAKNELNLLNVSNNTHLETLNCQKNKLKVLDVSKNINLSDLYCDMNNLKTLDVRNGNNGNFSKFISYNNPELKCILVDNKSGLYLKKWYAGNSIFVENKEECSQTD